MRIVFQKINQLCHRVEWRRYHQPGGSAGLHGSQRRFAINDAGQVVGFSFVGALVATEWSGGSIINLGGLPGATSSTASASTTPGRWWDSALGRHRIATEWSGGSIINLGGLPGNTTSIAAAINDRPAVGELAMTAPVGTPLSGAAAASSTWAVCRAPLIALPTPSTTPGRWWDTAKSAGSSTPPSGAAAASSTSAACRAPRKRCPRHQRRRSGGGIQLSAAPVRHRVERRQRHQPGRPAGLLW